MDLAKKDVVDTELDINYNLVEKKTPGIVIKRPVELEGPPQIPDKLLFPEQWKFYDGNLETVKPSVNLGGVFARDEFPDFKLKE